MKVLILHASAGAGHRRAAEALASSFAREQPHADVTVRDILEFTPALFRETYAKGYLRLVRKIPELWGYMYSRADLKAQKPWRKNVRAAFNKINVTHFLEFLDECSPDMTICTHFMPLEVLSTWARDHESNMPFFGVVTDFAVHSLWIVEGVACYYVATEEAKRHLVRRGQAEDRVSCAGIPVDEVFSSRTDAQQARKDLGLDPDLPTVLLLSGGYGIGSIADIAAAFRQSDCRCQLVAVAGTNEELRRDTELAARGAAVPARVYGFVDNIHELMDAADIIVSKPGGLTTSELLAKGKPMIITSPIPGQEQRNCEYLLESGVALRLYEAEDTPYLVSRLLGDTDRMDLMRKNAAHRGRPHAARAIVRDVVNRTFPASTGDF